jgi:hypothetical protein
VIEARSFTLKGFGSIVTAITRGQDATLLTDMRILGLPLPSFLVLIVVPAIIVGYQFYYCWQVYTGRRD